MKSAHPFEALGPDFDLARYVEGQRLTAQICQELAHSLTPGVYEEEAHEMFKGLLKKHGLGKVWHPTKIRFGANTLCNFREPGLPDQRLHEGELFFVDIGPIIDGHEGDYGETYRCGGGGDALITASREVFKLTEEAWLTQKLTGPALYQVAIKATEARGLKLNMNMDGHRLGDFPHHVHYKGDLATFEGTPVPGVWVLEIHVIDHERQRAAFFEDILGLDQMVPKGT